MEIYVYLYETGLSVLEAWEDAGDLKVKQRGITYSYSGAGRDWKRRRFAHDISELRSRLFTHSYKLVYAKTNDETVYLNTEIKELIENNKLDNLLDKVKLEILKDPKKKLENWI